MDKTKNVSIDELLENGDAVEMSHNEVRNMLPPEEEPVSVLLPTEETFDKLIARIDAQNDAVHSQFIEAKIEEEILSEENETDDDVYHDIVEDDTSTEDEIDEEDDLDTEITYSSVDMGFDALMDKKEEKPMKEVGPKMEPEVKRIVKVEEPVVTSDIPDKEDIIATPSDTVEKSVDDSIKIKEEVVIKEIPTEPEVEENKEVLPVPVIEPDAEVLDIEDDLDDDELDATKEYEEIIKVAEARAEKISDAVSKAIQPVKNPVALNTFKINKKVKKTPTSVLRKTLVKNHATWMTSGTKKALTMTEFTGPELLKINRSLMPEQGRATWLGNMLNIIYKHIQSPKPKTVTEWAKRTLLSDLDDIFFTIYASTYGTSNISYYDCPKCKHNWMANGLKLNEFYTVLDSDKFKEAINTNLPLSETEDIEVELVQVTDDLVYGIKPITLWDLFHVVTVIGDRYENIELLLQIDTIYAINRDDNSLEELDFKSYPDPDKTLKDRFKYLTKFVNILSPDQVSLLTAAISNLNSKYEPLVEYKIPETICPECGTHIDEQTVLDDDNDTPVSGEILLFMRHRLGAMRS